MKKILTLFFSFLLPYFVAAQVVTTYPAFITNSYNNAITVTFDPAQGNGGMVGATKCFAHTGLILEGSSTWQFAPAWRGGEEKYQMTKVGNNWQLTISPDIRSWYGCSADSVIKRIAFVFNDGVGGLKEGKNADGSDIFVDLVEEGLNVQFITPASNQLVNKDASVNFSATSSENANLELKINGTSKKSVNNNTTLTHTETFNSTGDFECIIFATKNAETVSDTVKLCVLTVSQTAALPSGITQAGIYYNENDATKATLVLYAKDKNNVQPSNILAIGDFNDWSYSNQYQLKQNGNGYWWITLENLVPQQEYAYQYAVKTGDNVVKISDAYTEKVLDGWNDKYISDEIYPNLKKFPTQTSELAAVLQTDKPQFNWSTETQNFSAPDKNNLVIYEMWIHDWSSYRSVDEVISRLDYLQSLGINALELMPICEFDGNISWGYNNNHYFAPDKAYGTETAYKTLIDECHKRGIAVILDMVFNHSTGNHPFAKLYWNGSSNVSANNPYYNVTSPHPGTGGYGPDFNHEFQETKDYFKRVLRYWLAEYKVDGFRMDLSKGFCGPNCNNRVSIINEYYNDIKSVKQNIYFILEHWNSSEEIGFVSNGMLCWGNGSGGNTNNAYSQTAMGWLKDGDNLSVANKNGWVSYAESHDEERNFYKAKQSYANGNLSTNETARLSRVPLNVAFSALLKGPQMLWQFEEMGYDYCIECSNGRTDPKPVPDALGWYSNSLRMSAYNKIAKIITLRTKLLPDLFLNGTQSNVDGLGTGKSLRKMHWSHNGKEVILVGNFNVDGGTQYIGSVTFTMPAGTWYNYLNNNAVQNGNTTLTLQAGEVYVFTNNNTIVAPADVNFDYIADVPNVFDENRAFIYPTITDSYLFLETSENVQNISVISLRGQQVLNAKNTKQINVSALQSGMYLMIVTFDKRQEAFKFIRK
ncbi:MAG: T9SS type A sorting domain-containing protein [Prevotellaceae bacterium]|jgi:hypothetical protein|nr:T9SS type A sorting domain-containing protein [Prevotellaceae bacterium]